MRQMTQLYYLTAVALNHNITTCWISKYNIGDGNGSRIESRNRGGIHQWRDDIDRSQQRTS